MLTDFNLKSVDISIEQAAAITGYSCSQLCKMHMNGELGEPYSPLRAGPLNLLHLAHAMALTEAARNGISNIRFSPFLASFAGDAYVQLALIDHTNRGWRPGKASPMASQHLFRLVDSSEGRAAITRKMPEASQGTRRVACFSSSATLTCDDLSETSSSDVPWPTVLDSYNVAKQINSAVHGILFRYDVSVMTDEADRL